RQRRRPPAPERRAQFPPRAVRQAAARRPLNRRASSHAFSVAVKYDDHHIQPGARSMSLSQAVVLVTGANRGIGLAFAREALARGARVYAAARDPASIQLAG